MSREIALIIIHNHRYDRNIALVEGLYRERFKNIYHLVPFYDGEATNVIPVYESSFYFQGFIAQGFKSFFDTAYSHYLFVADDLLLNPVITQTNYEEIFHLNENSSFIPYFRVFGDVVEYWHRTTEAFLYSTSPRGAEVAKELPSYAEAERALARFGLGVKPLTFDQVWPRSWFRETWRGYASWAARRLRAQISRRPLLLKYPLVGAYSDIVLVAGASIRRFAHLCGAFAASELFVEVAIPTALALCAEEIVTEKDLGLRGRALWTPEDHQELEKYGHSLDRLMRDFPQGNLYLHPIKLSVWH